MSVFSRIRFACLVPLFTGSCTYAPPTSSYNPGDGGAGGSRDEITTSSSSGAGGNPGVSSSSSGTAGMGGDSTSSGSGGAGGAGGSSSTGGMGGTTSSGAGGMGGAGGMPPVAFCDPTLPELIGCFRFDGDTNDESGKNNVVTATAITFTDGIDGKAANFDPGSLSAVRIADADHWDVTSFTVEMWYQLRSYPIAGTRMGVFDSDGRYGIFIHPSGELRFTRGGGVVNVTPIPLDTWTHIACVYGAGTARLYVNGTLVMQATATDPAPTAGESAIGANAPSNDTIDGVIDNVRIWNVVRTDQEICLAAGKPGC